MSLEKVDICMTATIRPKVIEQTLNSFCENMLTDRSRYRLIINIDPIGENIRRKYMVDMISSYFDETLFFCPKNAGFTKAVIWCWSKVKADYVFHLEDDWRLLKEININGMIKLLNKNETLASLRLSKDYQGKCKQGENLGFVIHPKISLNPTLFKGNFIKGAWSLMDDKKNPEKQLRINETDVGKYLKGFIHGIYIKDGYGRIVEDIGRYWMNNTEFEKEVGFMEWRKKS